MTYKKVENLRAEDFKLLTGVYFIEQEKQVKYLNLVASAVILQNAFDISKAIQAFSLEG